MRHLALPALAVCLFAWAAPAHAVKVERVTSAAGIEAWLVEDHTVPVVSLEYVFRAGAAIDPDGKEGLSRLAASLLDEAAGDLPSQEFQRRLEDLVSEIGFSATLDAVSGSLKSLKQNLAPTADLLRLAITAPRFDAPDIERLRTQLQVSLAREAEEPHAMAQRAWFRAAFPGHPYGRGSRGTAAGLANVTLDDLKAWVPEHLTRDLLVIGASGDITAAELAPLLDHVFGRLPPTANRPVVPDAVPADPGGLMLIERQLPQSVVLFGKSGIKRSDPDYYAAYILNHILGGGSFSSRLMDEVREKRGLAYSVYSFASQHADTGLWGVYVGCLPAKADEVLSICSAEVAKVVESGLTDAELDRGKGQVRGGIVLGLEDPSSRMTRLGKSELVYPGLEPVDDVLAAIDAVTHDDIRAIASEVLTRPKVLAVVGPFDDETAFSSAVQ
jgi:zinc protease